VALQKICPHAKVSEPVAFTLFGKRLFVNVIMDLEMRSPSWIFLGSKSNDKCLYKRRTDGDLR
jgi:hypothetical protein